MALADDLVRIAAAAEGYAVSGERVTGILAAEPHADERVYLCVFESGGGDRAWIGLDAHGEPVESRQLVHDAASIAALCEVAEETAGGGDLDELLSRLVALRLTEAPMGVDEAEEAVHELQRTIEAAPRLATPEYLDRLGAATRRLEQALGEGGSPFSEGMKVGMAAVEELTAEIERGYKGILS